MPDGCRWADNYFDRVGAASCGVILPSPWSATWQNQQMHRWPSVALVTLSLWVGGGTIAGYGESSPTPRAGGVPTSIRTTDAGPAKEYDCTFNVVTQALTGAYGTASEIGWEGNYQGVVTCLGGTFFVQDGINENFGFGIYTGTPTTWTNADGYLPAQVTTFRRSGAIVSITEFADKVIIGGNAYVAVYSRVAVRNSTDHVVAADPQASSGLVPLKATPNAVNPGASIAHDYVVAVDRFGNDYPWPSAQALATAGSFDQQIGRAHV